MGSSGEEFLLGLVVLFLGLHGLLEVDLVDFEKGGLEVMELGAFFEEVLELFKSGGGLLWVFVGDLGFGWLGGLFGGRFFGDL